MSTSVKGCSEDPSAQVLIYELYTCVYIEWIE